MSLNLEGSETLEEEAVIEEKEADTEEQTSETGEKDGETDGLRSEAHEEADGSEETGETEEEETVISIGEEEIEAPKEESSTIRKLREIQRQQKKRIRDLEQKTAQTEQAKQVQVSLRNKPKLEDFDYNADEYESDLEKWYGEKTQYDKRQTEIENERKSHEQQWQSRLENYEEKKKALNFSDFEDVEEVIKETLDVTKQGLIIQGADNPAAVVYALGKNPAKLKELAEITDPVKYTFAVAKLEAQIKMQKRSKPSTKPEKLLSGGGGGALDSKQATYEKLLDEGLKTGNLSKASEYRRKHNLK